jgi:Tol biopolymer transport system component/putative cell wall-binding protein
MRRFLVIAIVAAVLAWPPVASAQPIERIPAQTVDPRVSMSADGRYVAFASDASGLVAGDTNGWYDVFVYDRGADTIERVSVTSSGAQADGSSLNPAISADGRFVVFSSSAPDLVPGDTNGWEDVFIHDRQTGTTELVSVGIAGAGADFISLDCAVSGDGRYVAFSSGATNLVPDDTNDHWDVFVRDRQTGVTEVVSLADDESAAGDSSFGGCSISADGRYVAFLSAAADLVAGDTGSSWDVFVRDRTLGATERVSLIAAGDDVDAGCRISPDGSTVAYSWKSRLYVFDRTKAVTERVDVATGGAGADDACGAYSLSEDGRFVAFVSWADNLVAGDTNQLPDVFVRDRLAGTTERVSVAADGAQGDSLCDGAALSADGRLVGFVSLSHNLVPGDTDDLPDLFVVTRFFISMRGTDRYETAIKVSKTFYPTALPAESGLVLASGQTFQQALCGSPLAAAYGGPVLLTPPSGLATSVKTELLRLSPRYVFCIDLSESIRNSVLNALGPGTSVIAINGSTVYEMSYKVAKALEARLGPGGIDTALLVPGDKFPDAVSAASLAGHKGWPILLTASTTTVISAYAVKAMSELGIDSVIKIGTYVAIPPPFVGAVNLSGRDRYQTNINVAEWGNQHGDLTFEHLGLATGDKFPDALSAGAALASVRGVLLITPLATLDARIAVEISAHRAEVLRFYFVAMIEPVLGQVKTLLP